MSNHRTSSSTVAGGGNDAACGFDRQRRGQHSHRMSSVRVVDGGSATELERHRADLNDPLRSAKCIISSPHLIRRVYLHDWWLVKANMHSSGRQLGVGGFSIRESQGLRVISSAAITKRLNAVTLETVDGTTIILSGLLNRSRTLENGFPFKVCNRFLFGFPYYWEDYAAKCGEESRLTEDVPSSTILCNLNMCDGANTMPSPLDGLPVTRVRDLLMCAFGEPENHILTTTISNDILQKFGSEPSAANSSDKGSDSCQVMTAGKAPGNHHKRNKIDVVDASHLRREESSCPSHGSRQANATRSMTRTKNPRNNLLYKSAARPNKASDIDLFSVDKSAVRRSDRLKNRKT